MVRATNAVSARRRTKKLLKSCKGYYGDRKNHLRQSKNAQMSAMAFHYEHRKLKKRDFRSLWIMRISSAAKARGISYSKLIDGLKKAGCLLNRKWLSELAIADAQAFSLVAEKAKQALA